MPALTLYTLRYDIDDVYDGERPYGLEAETETLDCEPDRFDIDDGLSSTDLAARYLRDRGITEPSSSDVYPGLWWSPADMYVDPYTGECEDVSAHPDGFSLAELRIIAAAIR